MKLFHRTRAAAQDYDPCMLPRNRREVFLDVLKLNWKSFLLYGVLFLGFCLPLQLVTLSESMAVINFQAGDMAQMPYRIAMVRIIASIVKLPCFLLLAVGLSGFARVMRQYAWMENVRFSYEFWQGMKGNAGQMLLLAALAGVANVIAAVCIAVAETATDLLSSILLLAPAAVIILCMVPVLGYMVVSICIYKSSFAGHLQVGRMIYGQAFLKTLLALVCCLAPFGLQLIPGFLYQIIGAVVSPVVSPVVFFGWFLFVLEQLDSYINQERYPSLVGRGLYDPDAAGEIN